LYKVNSDSVLRSCFKNIRGQKIWDFAKYQSLILPYSNGQYLFCRMDFFPEKSGLDIFKTASKHSGFLHNV